MPECTICGGKIPDGSRTCPLCGSREDEFFPMGTMLTLEPAPQPAAALPADLPAGGSFCPACAKVYGPGHTDGYCACGTELLKELPTATLAEDVPAASFVEEIPMAPILDDLPMAPILDDPTSVDPGPILDVPRLPLAGEPLVAGESETELKVRGRKPPPGTPCVVLYGPDKQPLQYFALEKDAVLIGRLDAVAGNFPDIDLDQWFDRATIRKISRQHALVLRSRAMSTFVLRPLVGNTGTQLETQMLQPMHDYPLRPGHRIILGGVIRLKFEIS
jgi:hypothetical protein